MVYCPTLDNFLTFLNKYLWSPHLLYSGIGCCLGAIWDSCFLWAGAGSWSYPLRGHRVPVAPAGSRAAGRWQEQPEHWESSPPWWLDETRLGIIPRPGLVAGELGTGWLLMQMVVMSRWHLLFAPCSFTCVPFPAQWHTPLKLQLCVTKSRDSGMISSSCHEMI